MRLRGLVVRSLATCLTGLTPVFLFQMPPRPWSTSPSSAPARFLAGEGNVDNATLLGVFDTTRHR